MSGSIEAQLLRLQDAREELAREWILRVLAGSSLEQMAKLSVGRAARELPPLIGDLVDMLRGDGVDHPPAELGQRLAALREPPSTEAGELAGDVVTLQGVIVEALGSELPGSGAQEALAAVNRLAGSLSLALATATSELVGARSREFETLANTDPLTGLHNIRYMQRQLDQLLGAQARYGDPFAILMLDLDSLKAINDAYGHAAGDRALIVVAATIRRRIRVMDTAIRVSGDEFCVLAPRQTAAGGKALAERIQMAVARIQRTPGAPLSVSTGVASCPEHGADKAVLLELADRAMYRSKATGEGPVVSAAEPDGYRSSAVPS